jgi:hypothetical protein
VSCGSHRSSCSSTSCSSARSHSCPSTRCTASPGDARAKPSLPSAGVHRVAADHLRGDLLRHHPPAPRKPECSPRCTGALHERRNRRCVHGCRRMGVRRPARRHADRPHHHHRHNRADRAAAAALPQCQDLLQPTQRRNARRRWPALSTITRLDGTATIDIAAALSDLDRIMRLPLQRTLEDSATDPSAC